MRKINTIPEQFPANVGMSKQTRDFYRTSFSFNNAVLIFRDNKNHKSAVACYANNVRFPKNDSTSDNHIYISTYLLSIKFNDVLHDIVRPYRKHIQFTNIDNLP